MQYKVPQNVDIEDKVIAGLTLKQFIYLIVAGGIVLMLKYALPAPLQFLFMPLALIIGAAGAALAFIKVNDRPMESFIFSAAKTVITPNQRTWQKEGLQKNEKPIEEKPKDEFKKKENIEEIRSNLERLAMIVDSGAHGLVEERATNVKPSEPDAPAKVADILAATEKPSERLDKFIQNAIKSVASQEKEKPVSALSSNQNKSQFKYEQIETKSEQELEELIDKARAEDQQKEIKMQSAKIEKF